MAKLDDGTRELIAVGASVTANCQSCLEYHVDKARESGAAADGIREAIEVGRMVRRGAAAKLDKLGASLVETAPPAAASAPVASAGEACGCS